MSRTSGRRTAFVISLVVLASTVLATGVIASQFRSVDPPAFHAALDSGEVMRVADVEAGDALPSEGVFARLTETGQLCVWEAPSATSPDGGGGCNAADDPLNGNALSATLSYDGGPAVRDVKRATLFGLTGPTVARAKVLMSDGSSREVKLKKARVGSADFKAFGYRFKKADLEKGIGPTAIVAFDASGAEVVRQQTGIG
jgi:hypothetical protein